MTKTRGTLKRIAYLDLLRIISICAIMLLHAAGTFWGSLEVGTPAWDAANAYDCITRWGVPVFVMISGALFLDPKRPQPIRKLWTRNIPRIALIIVFWGLVYAVLYDRPAEMTGATLVAFLKDVVFGPFHFWFLFMLLGLYVLVPILRCVTASKTATEYFLAIGFVVNLVIPLLTFNGNLPVVREFLDMFLIQIPLGYSFLFVLGYYLSAFDLTAKVRIVIYVLGIAGLVAATIGTAELSAASGKPDPSLIGTSFSFVFAAMGVFLLVKQLCLRHALAAGPQKRIGELASCVLGVYAIHIIVMRALLSLGIGTLLGTYVFDILILAVMTTLVSFPIAYGLKQIPWIGTHVV